MGWRVRVFGCWLQAGERAVDKDSGLDLRVSRFERVIAKDKGNTENKIEKSHLKVYIQRNFCIFVAFFNGKNEYAF